MSIESGNIAEAGGRASFWTACQRGLRRRCPCCGRGRMFAGYLTPVEVCSACGETLSRFNADDFPAYFTIFVVGLVAFPTMMVVQGVFDPAMWLSITIALVLVTAFSLAFLPFIKGAIMGAMWSLNLLH